MINKVVDSYDEAVAGVFDGAVLLIGGFGPANGTPSNLIRAVHKKGPKNLTICMNTPGNGRQEMPPNMPRPRMKTPPNYDNGGILIQNDQVTKVIAAFPGNPMPGFASPLHDRRLAGTLEVEMVPQGTMAERIRAAKAGIPAFYTRTAFNTRLGEGKEVRYFDGEACVMEHALKGDFSLVRAYKADRFGNLVYQGTSRNFNATMAGASTVTIAEVDYLVEPGELDPEAVVTAGLYVDIVVVRKNPEEGI
ncbi:MAG: 3-oxoacid CoA-transferase subunit A [Dehalococcoidales bacterium]|nr:3-oxoacid CoA-transferase subunit A [Dehalococcoidales bacterium]